MSAEKKIDEALKILYGMAPKVDDLHEGQKAMDARLRAQETQAAGHVVEIGNLKERLDGLHGKVEEIKVAPPAAATPPDLSWWRAALEFVGALPAHWHLIASAVVFAAGIVTMAWRHRP